MLATVPGIAELFFTTYNRNSVWINFDMKELLPGSEPVRMAIVKNRWTVLSFDIKQKSFYVLSKVHENPDVPFSSIERVSYFRKLSLFLLITRHCVKFRRF